MSCFGYIWDELTAIIRLVAPSSLTNTLEITMNIVDLIMLGHIDKDSLAIGAIGSVYYNMLWCFMEGLLSAQDCLSSHSFGAVRHWLYVSSMVSFVVAIICTVILAFSPIIIYYAFQLDANFSNECSVYVIILIPSFWFQTIFRLLQKYFQSQHIMMPTFVCLLVGNATNLIANFVLMYLLQLDAIGCAISTSITRFVMIVLLGLYFCAHVGYQSVKMEILHVLTYDLHFSVFEQAYIAAGQQKQKNNKNNKRQPKVVELMSWSSAMMEQNDRSEDYEEEASGLVEDEDEEEVDKPIAESRDVDSFISRDHNSSSLGVLNALGLNNSISNNHYFNDCLRFLILGVPGAVVLVIDLWSFDIATILASSIGKVTLSAHEILYTYTLVNFVSVPMSIGIAASVRISQLVGSQNNEAARISSNIVIWMSFLYTIGSAYLLYRLRDVIGYVFTSDSMVVHRTSNLVFTVACFQIPYGVQGAAQGILRGLARNTELMGYTVLTFWCVSLPIGIYLSFFARPSFGIHGLWYGFIVGVGLLAILLVGIIWTIDWDYEIIVARIRIEKYSTASGFQTVQAAPVVGSRSLGGFLFFGASHEEELDEIERMSVNIAYVDDSSDGNNDL